jgi:hypothetical protein
MLLQNWASLLNLAIDQKYLDVMLSTDWKEVGGCLSLYFKLLTTCAFSQQVDNLSTDTQLVLSQASHWFKRLEHFKSVLNHLSEF